MRNRCQFVRPTTEQHRPRSYRYTFANLNRTEMWSATTWIRLKSRLHASLFNIHFFYEYARVVKVNQMIWSYLSLRGPRFLRKILMKPGDEASGAHHLCVRHARALHSHNMFVFARYLVNGPWRKLQLAAPTARTSRS